MRNALLLPDPSNLNVGFLARDRVSGLGDYDADIPANPGGQPAPANTTTPGFWSGVGDVFSGAIKAFTPGLISWGITGNRPQSVVTPTGQIVLLPAGTQTLAAATGSTPTWLLPVVIGAAALVLVMAKRK